MNCKNPYFEPKYRILVPCRQCLPCRINRRREWFVRALLESSEYQNMTFLTLTYDDEHLPLNGSLVSSDLSKFWKRLRKFGLKFRYLACGEYGERSYRPHYHAIIYGVDSAVLSVLASKFWQFGFVYSVPATVETLKYVCGYVTKKIAVRRDLLDLGMTPEFIRVSQGLGRSALSKLKNLALVQNDSLDVLSTLKIGDKNYQLPRYLKEKLRQMVFDSEYQDMLKIARVENMQEDCKELVKKHFPQMPINANYAKRSHIIEHEQEYKNLVSKDKLWNSRSKV